jgi:hypothetical protein
LHKGWQKKAKCGRYDEYGDTVLRGAFHNSAEIMREIPTRKQAIQRTVELAGRAVEKWG